LNLVGVIFLLDILALRMQLALLFWHQLVERAIVTCQMSALGSNIEIISIILDSAVLLNNLIISLSLALTLAGKVLGRSVLKNIGVFSFGHPMKNVYIF